MNIGEKIAVTFVIVLCIFFIYTMWQFVSPNGRWTRDFGISSSGLSDGEVKGIWCGIRGFPNSWSNKNGQNYCGDIPVTINCRFTNSGDYCDIEEQRQA